MPPGGRAELLMSCNPQVQTGLLLVHASIALRFGWARRNKLSRQTGVTDCGVAGYANSIESEGARSPVDAIGL
jgi:hypothetical protein